MSETKIKEGSVAALIKEFYPEYWGRTVSYPADKCACIHKVDEKWGVFSNFGKLPLIVDGVKFYDSEQLFQIMKFRDADIVKDLYSKPVNMFFKKTHVRKYEKAGKRREDWGSYFIDALKFCLMQKYEQLDIFRKTLEESRGLYIVELSHRKTADAYSVILTGDKYEGYNLLGELLMELRDNGKLEYHLPDDALDFIEALK